MKQATGGGQGAAFTKSEQLDRREFLRLALMSSAILAAPEVLLANPTPPQQATPFHGHLLELAPGEVTPEGWLGAYMRRQAAELGSNLPKISWPFSSPYWEGEEVGESWWPWEQRAYWIDGATRLGIVLQDEALYRQAGRAVHYTLQGARPNGYLGPDYLRNLTKAESRWPHMLLFRSFAAAHDGRVSWQAEDASQLAQAMRAFYLSDGVDYGKPERNITHVETMLWCYSRTGDSRLREKAEQAWRDYLTVAEDPDHGDLSTMRVYAATPINAHGVTYAEIAKQPAILYMHTGNPEHLRFALAAQRRIFDHHMLIDGIPSTSEWFRTRTSLDSHETCDIADHTWTWGYMLMATGDGVWADRIERACFNAAPGAIRNDWKSLQYFSCPNQFLATLHSDHNVMEHGGRMMAYQPNPGQHTACCGGNVHRIFPNYTIRMWMKDADGGLAAVLYGPSRLKTTAGPENQPIEILQETNYPFEEEIRFTIRPQQPMDLPLSFRIPGWCAKPSLLVNGSVVDGRSTMNGFLTVRRRFKPGDIVTLRLPMDIALSRWPQGGVAIERGPLVYSLPIREKWTSLVEPKYTTAEFPSWEAQPAGDWNYGLAATTAADVHVNSVASPDDPWANPPVQLQVQARKISGWALQPNPDDTQQVFTPPLPEPAAGDVSETAETINLLPYGSTRLRVTIFPDISEIKRS